MSAFKKMFGSKKSDPSKEQEAALQRLKTTQDLLTKKSLLIENKINEELQNARNYGMKKKNLALAALARKKKYEKQLKQIDGAQTTIENQIHAIENTGMLVEVMDALKSSSAAMKAAQKNMSIDDIHDIMDTVADQLAVSDEMADALTSNTLTRVDYDEDELLAELEGLQNEQLEKDLLDVGSISNLPEVPTRELPKPSTSKVATDASQKDLNELLAWAE